MTDIFPARLAFAARLAAPIRALHDRHRPLCARGRICVSRGESLLARLAGGILRLPHADPVAATSLIVTSAGGIECWDRSFAGRHLTTTQYFCAEGHLVERFGVLEFRYQLQEADGGLRHIQRDAALRLGKMRIPIPRSWAPRVNAREDPAGPDGVHVAVRGSRACRRRQ